MRQRFAKIYPGPLFTRAGLHWVFSAVLLVGTSTLAPMLPPSTSASEPFSVLELQQLVDAMLLTGRDEGTPGSTNVLELQRALLDTVQPDEFPEDAPNAPRDAGVLPVPARFLLPAAHALPPMPDALSADQVAAVAPPPTGHLPPTAGTRMRYQFHLLSNAPPATGFPSMNRFSKT